MFNEYLIHIRWQYVLRNTCPTKINILGQEHNLVAFRYPDPPYLFAPTLAFLEEFSEYIQKCISEKNEYKFFYTKNEIQKEKKNPNLPIPYFFPLDVT